MAVIRPFRAYRYTDRPNGLIEVLSPLQESDARKRGNQHPDSTAFLGTPAADIKNSINRWITDRVIAKDPIAALYVYFQYFFDQTTKSVSIRKGFISLLKIEDWKDNIILKHEDTLPSIEEFQEKLLNNTQFYVNPIHGLYKESDNLLDAFMEESILHPVMEMEDNNGVTHKLSVIQDKKCIEKFIDILKNKQIVIADGHHRYAAALKLSQKTSSVKTSAIPAFLTNTSNNTIALLPFYTLLSYTDFNDEKFINFLSFNFNIKEEKDILFLQNAIRQNIYTFGLITKKTSYIIELKSEITRINYPSCYDLRIVEDQLIKEIIASGKVKKSLNYVHTIAECIQEINSGSADIAFLVKELTVNEVMDLSENGLVLPEKSTYFYPKVLGGIVMSSTESTDGEIESPCFRNI